MHEVHERNLFEVYASVSGRKPGEGMGMLRDIIIADTDEEARQLWADSATFAGNAWFVPFGFRRGMLDPKTGEAPSAEEAIAKGYALVGTVDTVTRSLEALKRKLPVNWIFGWTHNTLVPHAKLMRSIERFYTEMLPRVRRCRLSRTRASPPRRHRSIIGSGQHSTCHISRVLRDTAADHSHLSIVSCLAGMTSAESIPTRNRCRQARAFDWQSWLILNLVGVILASVGALSVQWIVLRPMFRGFPKSRYRPSSGPATPFHSVLDQVGRQNEPPAVSVSATRTAPAGGWTYAAAEPAAVSSAASTTEMYVHADTAGRAPTVPPHSVEETVSHELQLSDDLAPADLERIRTTFAYRNHPDRVGPAHKMHALRRMTVANVLIDQALKSARARTR